MLNLPSSFRDWSIVISRVCILVFDIESDLNASETRDYQDNFLLKSHTPVLGSKPMFSSGKNLMSAETHILWAYNLYMNRKSRIRFSITNDIQNKFSTTISQ